MPMSLGSHIILLCVVDPGYLLFGLQFFNLSSVYCFIILLYYHASIPPFGGLSAFHVSLHIKGM